MFFIKVIQTITNQNEKTNKEYMMVFHEKLTNLINTVEKSKLQKVVEQI